MLIQTIFSKTFTSINMVFFLIMIITVIRIFFMRKQLLLLLITLELINLIVFIILLLKIVSQIQPISIAFYILIIRACEASMALRLIIRLTRIKGSDILRLIRKFQF